MREAESMRESPMSARVRVRSQSPVYRKMYLEMQYERSEVNVDKLPKPLSLWYLKSGRVRASDQHEFCVDVPKIYSR